MIIVLDIEEEKERLWKISAGKDMAAAKTKHVIYSNPWHYFFYSSE
jgi:hypothetical protein